MKPILVVVGDKKNHRLTYKITKLTVTEDSSVDDYKKINEHDLKEVLDDIKDTNRWSCTFAYDEKNEKVTRVSGVVWPLVDGRTGHPEDPGGYKYHIDRTAKSEDRLILDKWSATVKNQANHGVGKLKGMTELSADVEITVHARALADTHSGKKK
jgi:hypothetical protein